MATQVQLRRGTEAEQDLFTGAQGELTYSTDSKGLRIHDGATMGGFPIDVVIAWQKPTAENNYTWYRKYSSGWVEQGGYLPKSAHGDDDVNNTVTLPVEMANAFYTILTNITEETVSVAVPFGLYTTKDQTTKTFKLYTGEKWGRYWRVEGMAA